MLGPDAQGRASKGGGRRSLLDFISRGWVRGTGYGLLVIFFIVLVLTPTLYVLSKLFTGWGDIQQAVLSDPTRMGIIWDAMLLSFGVAFTVVALDLIFGLPLAWIIVRKEFKGKAVLNTIIDSPLAVPTAGLGISVALFWGALPFLADRPAGAWSLFGGFDSPFLILVLLHLTTTFPYMVRSLAAILNEIDIEYETAARTCGASRLTAARTITLPLFRSGLATGAILCLAKALSETGGVMAALSLLYGSLNESSSLNGTALIGVWKGQSITEPTLLPALTFVSVLMIILSLILLALVKFLTVKFHIPFRKVWPKFEKRLSKGLTPHLRNAATSIFLVVMILVPSFFIIAFMATSSPATPTPANSYGITVSGSSGPLTHSQPVQLDVDVPPPTGFYLDSSPRMQYTRPGGSINYTIILTSIEGFSLPVNLTTSSLPPGMNVSFNPTSVIPTNISDFAVITNLTISEGEYLLEIVATADSITHKLNVTLLVTTTPDFLITVDPYLNSIAIGDSATYSVSLTSVEGFTSPVDLAVDNLPLGARVTFNRTSIIPNGSAFFTIITIKPVDWSLFWNGIFLSLVIAGIATGIDLLLGIPLAIMIVRGRFKKLGGMLDVLVNIPYVVPTAALGISLGFFYRDLGIQGFDILIVTMAHVAFTFPFIVRNVVGGLEGLDPGYEDTARTLGAKPFQTFKRVMFPIIKPSILAGAIMAFTRSIGETGATLAVSNQVYTAPLLIVRYTGGVTRDLYTAGLLIAIMIIVSSIAILAMRLLASRRRISA